MGCCDFAGADWLAPHRHHSLRLRKVTSSLPSYILISFLVSCQPGRISVIYIYDLVLNEVMDLGKVLGVVGATGSTMVSCS